MGAWGIKALESDTGLDLVDFLEEYKPGSDTFDMSEIIEAVKEEGFLGEDFDQIDFLYDNTAMGLAELYLEFLDEGKMDYTHLDEEEEEEEDNNQEEKSEPKEIQYSLTRIKTFTASREALEFLLRYLTDIRNEVPDADDEREIVELWQDSDSWEEWSEHLDNLIKRYQELIGKS